MKKYIKPVTEIFRPNTDSLMLNGMLSDSNNQFPPGAKQLPDFEDEDTGYQKYNAWDD